MTRKRLIEKLKNLEYRQAFASAQARRYISAQIRALRTSGKRGWTQQELGTYAGMKQNAIARLENPNYGEYSVRTLQRLAAAFDVALVVKFAPFSEVVRANQEATLADLTPAFFAEDKGLIDADVTYALSETINIINSPLSTNKDTYSHYQFSLLTGPVGPQTEIQPIVPHVAYVPAPSQTAWLN